MKTPDIPPSLRYKKYDWTELHKIDQNTLKEISRIDTLFRRSPSDLKEHIERSIINADKNIIYLCYREKELVGAIFGNLQRVSQFFYNRGYKIEAKPKDYMFSLTEFFVKPGNQKQGIGTKLMARVIADQRARYNSKFVYMIAYSKTHNINQKLTGKKPFIVPISRTQNTNIKKSQTIFTQKLKNIIENLKAKKEKKVYRNFKHSRYKYDLVSIKEYKDTHYNYIVTKKNPKYKRKQIKRRNTIRRSVAK